MSGKPEEQQLPGEWSSKCTDMQKLLLIRAMRIDRLLFSAVIFIAANIGRLIKRSSHINVILISSILTLIITTTTAYNMM
jgi:hypothetical protein